MSLKQIIRKSKLGHYKTIRAQDINDLVMKQEPMPYSAKLQVGRRILPAQHWRNVQWYSPLKCCIPNYKRKGEALVLLIRFYVSPNVELTDRQLKAEGPATEAFELCEYLLSFLEMLIGNVYSSHRQIVKVDMEKHYSKDPRTEFKLIPWREYAKLPVHPADNAGEQKKRKPRQRTVLQPEQPRDEQAPGDDPGADGGG